MSTYTGTVVLSVQAVRPDIPPYVTASALAIITGAVVCFIGIIRCGFVVELISLTAVSAFITGSAINIAVGQVPTLMGITGFNTRDATYMVVINTLKYLPQTKLDAALGLTSLAMLYIIRFVFQTLAKRQPQRRKLWFFCNTLRSVFVILLYTLIGWLCNLHLKNHDSKNSPFKILGSVPRGFTHAAVPQVNSTIIRLFASQIPATVIVMLIEHIAIAKQFGRVNNYTINPSQELVAIGVSNLLGPFLGGYPSTGSFSRTAIKSKAGVRTPLAGVITALVVLLAIYALTAVFFYIPSAALSGIIIHAVGDLITPPNTVYQFWKVSPLEVPIFFAGVLVTIFSSIEDGIYTTLATSFALLLWRIFKAQGRFLGRLQVHSVVGDHVLDAKDGAKYDKSRPTNDPDKSVRNIFVPIDHGDGSNPNIEVEHPHPGVFIYRFSEGYNYPNASHYLDFMVATIFQQTRRTSLNAYARLGDRPWNDPGTRRVQGLVEDDGRPTLKAIILDFSSVNNVDVTSVQHLIDVRNQLDRYAAPNLVHWHIACINNRWTKRSLAAAGFGYPTPEAVSGGLQRWKPIFSVAEFGGSHSAAAVAEDEANRREFKRQHSRDIETGQVEEASSRSSSNSVDREINKSKAYQVGTGVGSTRIAAVQGLNRPLFHIDLTSALQSAISIIEGEHGRQELDASTNGPEKAARETA